MSSAVSMFLRQIVLQRGIPFEMKLPEEPLALGAMTKEEFDYELESSLHFSCKVRLENNRGVYF
ncbi:MAG: type II toxin-antitoxin system RelB/DinJ family antitoxin [Firmicutes bacterium]|nr:type II toxin-antitoxin system RelB/DinJ family antitoxin [Bacillota bacterium]